MRRLSGAKIGLRARQTVRRPRLQPTAAVAGEGKFMLFVLLTVPATLAERQRLRPIGRNTERYQQMLDELRKLAVFADDAPRFTSHLMPTWLKGDTARVQTPCYVRDNIPVSLLAKGYAAFVAAGPAAGGACRRNPSCYPESQGAFAKRMRREAEVRLGRPCPLELDEQTEFPEPPVRINTDPLDGTTLGWDESAAWNEFVRYCDASPRDALKIDVT
jgi:hypothetical protein